MEEFEILHTIEVDRRRARTRLDKLESEIERLKQEINELRDALLALQSEKEVDR